MCGILGLTVKKESEMSIGQIEGILGELFRLSETRGSESSGVAVRDDKLRTISVYKQPIRATKMIKTKEYKDFFKCAVSAEEDKKEPIDSSLVVIGHSRLVTNGSQEDNDNNQPVIKSGVVAVHNGIIVNVDELWQKYSAQLERKYEVDTEIFLDLLRLYLKQGKSTIEAVRKVFAQIYGSASVAVLMNDRDKLLLATNTGSLYYVFDSKNNLFVFASEKYITQRVGKKLPKVDEVKKLEPFTGMLIDLDDLSAVEFGLSGLAAGGLPEEKEALSRETYEIKDFSPKIEKIPFPILSISEKKRLEALLKFDDVRHLKRCRRCVLPETMPFIEFDEKGICNYCRNYSKKEYQGEDKLLELVEQYRSKSGEPDCIVSFSGGRDSSYGLHYIKTILKMNPIAFTYDWGMVTDLARRNQARICGKLGIEHILLSADIRKKRENIRKNVLAWLKKPNLGIIPLFMAGDKQVHYYVNKLKEKIGLRLNIWMVNRLETTDFKVGFCSIPPVYDKNRPDYLPARQKMGLAAYYLKASLANPALINSSIFDTLGAYYASYFTPRPDHYRLYDFLRWDEDKIVSTLLEEYDWEISPDTKTTWRIGDGTASFYNYIYYTVAGFTESDTFRSNQVREGMLNREKALEIAQEENKPRFESIKWYCNTIGIDFESVIKIINSIPKLYQK